jgi:para-nitrobenzyl esterase
MKRLLALAMIVAPLAIAALKEPIQVDGGLITGTPTPQWTPGERLFRGIPYAAPPVGDLRWRPPQPVVPWQGVKAADHFSNVCMQPATDTEGNAWREGLVPMSEDCLYVNVWTPATSEIAKLPVMVFIHGGGNNRGAASENQYDGAYLAKKGVVFVSLNYRMNIFGFMAHPDLTRESEHHSSGNYAMLDQIAALQWVQRNIAKFGGDPNTVMIFGHSAGASNVSSLMATPLAKGLFHRVLTQSGANLNPGRPLAEVEQDGLKFAQSLKANSIADLRKIPAEDLEKAQRPAMALNVDGWALPQDVYTIFATGKQNDVPLITGTMADDLPGPGTGQGPATVADAASYAKQTFGALAGTYLRLYPATTEEQLAKSNSAFRTERALANARLWVRLQTKTGKSKAYLYYFTHTSPFPEGLMWGGRTAKSWGAYHGGEMPYVFNAFPLQDWPWRPVDLKLGDTVSTMWTNFVKTGNPNGPGAPEWPTYDAKSDILMNISDTPKAQPAPFKEKLDFLEQSITSQRK